MRNFFMTLGIIFFFLLIASAIFIVIDPYNLRPILSGSKIEKKGFGDSKTTETVVDSNPILNDSQENVLRKVGIDPTTIPSSISPEQEACFVEKLGQKRVGEIVAGDTPTMFEIISSAGCIN